MPDLTVESRIAALRPNLTLKDQKRLRLDTLLRLVRRLDALSAGCDSCPGHRLAIDRLVGGLDKVDSWSLSDWKAYYHSLDDIIRHLKTAHRLSEENEKMGMWLPIGAGVGVAFGVTFNSIPLGLVLGVGGGLAFGAMLDAVAHKQGRVI
jgi:hypothetical protein